MVTYGKNYNWDTNKKLNKIVRNFFNALRLPKNYDSFPITIGIKKDGPDTYYDITGADYCKLSASYIIGPEGLITGHISSIPLNECTLDVFSTLIKSVKQLVSLALFEESFSESKVEINNYYEVTGKKLKW